VVPAFNESESVAAVVREIFSELPGVAVLVVDDGSRDSTAVVARKVGARVAVLPFNLGVGGAMRVGFRYALDNGYEHVVQIDADGQHDPKSIPLLLAELQNADVVLGARFAGEGAYRVRGPRQWAMKALAVVLSKTCRTKLTDTTSGNRASGPRAITLFAEHYPAEYLGDTVESLVISARAGLTIRQIAVVMRARQGGVPSHNPVKSGTYLARAVLALVFALVRPRSSYAVVAQ